MNPVILSPTYNEAENIKEFISAIFDDVFADREISVVIIDDNSPDGTADIVEELQNRYKNLYLIKRQGKLGLASAYKAGLKFAAEKGFDVFIQADADFQHPLDSIPEMLEKIGEYDYVSGSRYVNDEGKFPFCPKSLLSIMGNLYINLILKTGLKDVSGGFNIYTKYALKVINPDEIISNGFMFQVEMKYRAVKNGLKVIEVPICFNERKAGKSKMTLGILYEIFINTLKIKQ